MYFDFGFVAMTTKFGIFLHKIEIASSFLFLDEIEPFLGR